MTPHESREGARMAAGSSEAGSQEQAGPELRDLPPALLLHVLQHLPPNEVACTARLVCKEWAEACSRPQHRTVRLSQPLPPHAVGLVRCWEGGLPRLSFRGKLQLLSAAASGCETNLEVAWALLQPSLLKQLPPRHYLRHLACDPGTVAATHGHAHLLPWLLEHRCPIDLRCTLEAVAEHCDLAALRCAWERLSGGPAEQQTAVAGAAARSRTPDALDKMEWVLAHHSSPDAHRRLWLGAVQCGDLSRLRCLRDRGVAPDASAVEAALEAPAAGVEVAEWLEQQGAGSVVEAWRYACPSATKLEWLASLPGTSPQQWQWDEVCLGAAHDGDLPMVAHLHASRGVALSAGLWKAAAASGSTELLAWLLSRGCPLDGRAFWPAVRSGSTSLMEWLLHEARCPLPGSPFRDMFAFWPVLGCRGAAGDGAEAAGDGDPDLLRAVRLLVGAGAVVEGSEALNAAARRGDLPLAQLMHSLGGVADKRTLEAAAEGGCEALLRWVLEQGCPLDWGLDAYVAAGLNGDVATLRLLLALGVPCGLLVVRAVRGKCSPAVAEALVALRAELRG